MADKPLKLPSLLKHMTMAVYGSDYLHASGGKERFEAALNIARARLVEYGYLQRGSDTGPIELLKLTSKGNLREMKHKYGEGRDNAKKNAAFDSLYAATFDKKAETRTQGDKSETLNKHSPLKPAKHDLKDKAKPLQTHGESLKPDHKPLHPKKVPLKDQF